MRLRKTLTVVGAVALGISLFAQAPRRDGKWEVKMEMSMAGMNLPAQTMTQCVTPQQAADPLRAVPQGRGRGGPASDCKVSDYKFEGGKATWTMTCSEMTGSGEFIYAGETYTGTMKMNMQGQEMTMKYSGKRLGDCTE
jgi:Protein of unknown function (DUF3617)